MTKFVHNFLKGSALFLFGIKLNRLNMLGMIFMAIAEKQEERTLLLIKPDGVRDHRVGNIISRIENRRFTIDAIKTMTADDEILKKHYSHLVDKPFFPGILKYMESGAIVALVVSGTNVINVVHKMAGATNPSEAAPGTIRGDFAREWTNKESIHNVVHTSDSVESAEREIALWFPELAK